LAAIKIAPSSNDLRTGTTYTPSQTPKRSKVSDRLARRGCIDLLEQLGVPLQVQTKLLSLLTISAQHLMRICYFSTVSSSMVACCMLLQMFHTAVQTPERGL